MFIVVAVPAVLIGVGIGQGQWIFGLSALLIPVLLVYPVQVGLGLFALILPFDSIAVLGQAEKGRTLTWFAGAAAISILLGAGLATRRLKFPPAPTMWWILFSSWAAVTAVWALDLQTSLDGFPTTLAVLALYIVSSCFRYTETELRAVTFLAILGGCVAAIWTAYLFRQGNFYEMGETRASLIAGGRATNPDLLAMTLLLPISLAFGSFLSSKRGIAKAGMLLAIAITTLGLFLTMSRGAVVALIVMLFVYLYRLRVRSRLVVPLVLLAILLCFMPSVFFARFREASANGGSGRLDIWKVGLTAFGHYGFFGAGLYNFPLAYAHYAGEAHHFAGLARDSHNIYLSMGVELGLVGVLLFGFAMRRQLRAASNEFKNHSGVNHLLVATEATVWGMLAYGFFGNILWSKGFWFALMLLTAVCTSDTPKKLRLAPSR